MKKRSILIIVSLMIFQNCFCQISAKFDSIQKVNFDNSDIVLLGEVLKFDTLNNLTSQIKVLEIFKGDTTSYIDIKFNGENTILPISDGLWLIYANRINENFYFVNRFGISRSNKEPDRISYYVPKFPKNKEDSRMLKVQIDSIKISAMVDWFNELYKLKYTSIKQNKIK